MRAEDLGGWDSPEWDHVTDVLVVGTGVAGGAAALAATRAGAEVILLDKAEHPGGTTASSGGGMWIPNNSFLQARGVHDDRDTCIRYMARSAYPALYKAGHPTLGLPANRLALIESFFDHAAGVIDEIMADGVLDFEPYHFPDYYSDLPEAVSWGHSVTPRLPADWKRGDPGGGELLASSLRTAAESRGARTRLDSRVVDLVTNADDEVVGVLVHHRRTTELIGARRGVVFGSGGFLHDPGLAREWLRGPVFGGAAAATSTGDFVGIAARAGAQLGNMTQAWWDQVVLEQALRKPQTSRDIFNVYGDAMIVVNRHGLRIMNEKAPYTDRGQAHFHWDGGRHEFPNRVTFMIFDDRVRSGDNRHLPGIHGSRMARFPVPFPGEQPDYLISGDTWDELAIAISDRLGALAPELGEVRLSEEFVPALTATVARFNDHAEAGHDPDFQRGRTLIELAWAAPEGASAADTMAPFAPTGPYHCVILGAGAIDTKGGPVTDGCGRVLTASGEPIPGLFGAGNCVASPSGQAYWGPGTTIGLGITFGYLAGRAAAGEAPRKP